MDIRVGIIGGTGGTGKWFADFLTRAGCQVEVSGRREGGDPTRLAETSHVVIIAVPMNVTEETIALVGPKMQEDALLMDLTSVKEKPVKAMLRASSCEVIGCHPLFGPNVDSIAGQNVVICPARSRQWLPWWKSLLQGQGAVITEMAPEEHDRLMAVVQGLNHLNTITMGMVMNKKNLSLGDVQGLTTPIFAAKAAILTRVLGNNPGLYADLLTQNDHLEEIVDIYEETLRELKTMIKDRDREGLVGLLTGLKRGDKIGTAPIKRNDMNA